MAGDEVAQVKAKTDIVSVIGEHVELKRAGRNFKANCPFHTEKTASFVVSPELQIYKCFGCGESGDVFEFLQKIEGLDFYETLTTLAAKAGVKLTPRRGDTRDEKQQLFATNAVVAKFYNYVLTSHATGKMALDYLVQERGLSHKTITEFNLGYSPDTQFALKALVSKKKVTEAALEKVGILYKGRSGAFDRFRGRVVFPLVDHRGNVAGFAGRLLPGAKSNLAKYINTPETPIYHKSNLLYGLNLAKDEIKKSKYAVIVEGELDMISVFASGVKNTVAIKGSAVTTEQATLLSRFCDKVVLALDSDAAGSEATLRGMVECDKVGLEVTVADLGSYKDPDEMARKAPAEFKRAVVSASSIWDFVINTKIAKYGLASGAAKAKVSRELTPVLKSIEDKIVQSHYIRLVAAKLGVSEEAVTAQISATSARFLPQKSESQSKPATSQNREETLETLLLSLAFRHNPDFLTDKTIQSLLQEPLHQRLVTFFVKYKGKEKEFEVAEFAKKLPPELTDGFTTLFLEDIPSTKSAGLRELAEVAKQLKRSKLKAQIALQTQEIKKLEQTGDKTKLKEAEAVFSNLTKELTLLAKNTQ